MIVRCLMLGAVLGFALQLSAARAGKAGFDSVVSVFFKANCVKCHGPDKAKGKVTLHNLDGDLGSGKILEHWELILDVLKASEMPPEEENNQQEQEELKREEQSAEHLRARDQRSTVLGRARVVEGQPGRDPVPHQGDR